MRLTCPACAAQYEVPDSAIPLHGREVQCSVCSETWFQEHPDEPDEAAKAPQAPVEASDAPADASVSDDPEEASTTDQKDDGAATEQTVDEDTSDQTDEAAASDETDDDPTTGTDASETEAEQQISRPRRPLDPAVADVLREEAELEARARRNELSGAVESQPDLGLGEAPVAPPRQSLTETTAPSTPAPVSTPSHEPEAEPSAAGSEELSAREALPDIEEINSTLRSNEARPDGDPGQTAQVERRAFRSWQRGFTLIVALAAVLVLIYAFAPQIAQALPQADPWLSAYVAQVDAGRLWLDGHVQDLLAWLDRTAASSSE